MSLNGLDTNHQNTNLRNTFIPLIPAYLGRQARFRHFNFNTQPLNKSVLYCVSILSNCFTYM